MGVDAELIHRAGYAGDEIPEPFFAHPQFLRTLRHRMFKRLVEHAYFVLRRLTFRDIAKNSASRDGYAIDGIETDIAFHDDHTSILGQKRHFHET